MCVCPVPGTVLNVPYILSFHPLRKVALLSCPFHRAETRFRGASTCQAPRDPEFGHSGSRAQAHGHLAGCMRFRGRTAVLCVFLQVLGWGAAQTWGIQAGTSGGIHQSLEGRKGQCLGGWNLAIPEGDLMHWVKVC